MCNHTNDLQQPSVTAVFVGEQAFLNGKQNPVNQKRNDRDDQNDQLDLRSQSAFLRCIDQISKTSRLTTKLD